MGAGMFHTDRCRDKQTDTTKLILAFRKFVNAPKNKYEFKCAVSPVRWDYMHYRPSNCRLRRWEAV